MDEKLTDRDILNKNIDLFEFDSFGPSHQDFHTKDKRIVFMTRRVGGGFTQGYNFYHLKIDGVLSVYNNLGDAYKKIVEFLNLG